jgi:hypothetical protein
VEGLVTNPQKIGSGKSGNQGLRSIGAAVFGQKDQAKHPQLRKRKSNFTTPKDKCSQVSHPQLKLTLSQEPRISQYHHAQSATLGTDGKTKKQEIKPDRQGRVSSRSHSTQTAGISVKIIKNCHH